MKILRGSINPKEILAQACRCAAKGEKERALDLFQSSVQTYLDMGLPLKALAAAKAARTALGASPKVQGFLIRLYTLIGRTGDALQEYHTGSTLIRKDIIPLLRGLSPEEILDFLDIMEILYVANGDFVLRQGETGEDLYIVISGNFEVLRDAEHLSVIKPGDIFGEIGFFHHARRSASVKAVDDATIIRIPSEPLRSLCRKYPGVAHALEKLYTWRVIKKASEDIHVDAIDLGDIAEVHFTRGEEIPRLEGITIVKHGFIEVNYGDEGPPRKRFFGPGMVLENVGGSAKANTDVDIIHATPDITGRPRYRP
jgi:CRP-like cAMP-binding protein